MAKRYSGGWEGPAHFSAWARLYADETYDPECDGLARYVVARWAWEAPRNEGTAAAALLNQWACADCPEAWDAALAFMASSEALGPIAFEAAADAFLESIGHLAGEKKRGSDTQAAADARDWGSEKQAEAAARLPAVLEEQR